MCSASWPIAFDFYSLLSMQSLKKLSPWRKQHVCCITTLATTWLHFLTLGPKMLGNKGFLGQHSLARLKFRRFARGLTSKLRTKKPLRIFVPRGPWSCPVQRRSTQTGDILSRDARTTAQIIDLVRHVDHHLPVRCRICSQSSSHLTLCRCLSSKRYRISVGQNPKRLQTQN